MQRGEVSRPLRAVPLSGGGAPPLSRGWAPTWCAHALLDSGPHGQRVLRIRGHGPCCALQRVGRDALLPQDECSLGRSCGAIEQGICVDGMQPRDGGDEGGIADPQRRSIAVTTSAPNEQRGQDDIPDTLHDVARLGRCSGPVKRARCTDTRTRYAPHGTPMEL